MTQNIKRTTTQGTSSIELSITPVDPYSRNITLMSTWNRGVSYIAGDYTIFDGRIYRCLINNTDVLPYDGEFESDILEPGITNNTGEWQLI